MNLKLPAEALTKIPKTVPPTPHFCWDALNPFCCFGTVPWLFRCNDYHNTIVRSFRSFRLNLECERTTTLVKRCCLKLSSSTCIVRSFWYHTAVPSANVRLGRLVRHGVALHGWSDCLWIQCFLYATSVVFSLERSRCIWHLFWTFVYVIDIAVWRLPFCLTDLARPLLPPAAVVWTPRNA